MLRYLAKPEPDMADVAQPNLRGTGRRPWPLLPCHSPPPLARPIRSPASPRLPLLQSGKRRKEQGHFAPLVMEVRTGTGCSQV